MKKPREIVTDFLSKYNDVDNLIDNMEKGSVELFETDPEYSEILHHFGESLFFLQEDMYKKSLSPAQPNVPISVLLSKQETERIIKVWTFCTILYTIIQNLEQANIIKIIPPKERTARNLWRKAQKN